MIVILGFIVLLLFVVSVSDSGSLSYSGTGNVVAASGMYQNEVWTIPCNEKGASDFVGEILNENYDCQNYCYVAAYGLGLPLGNVAVIKCEDSDERTDWIEMCNEFFDQSC